MLKSAAQYARNNAVAFLALGVALGGTGAYAADEWNGSNIQDETLTGADVRGKAATTATPPVNGSITTHDIAGQAANAAHGTPAIDGTLTTYDIGEGQVRGSDLRDGTVANGDLDDDAVTGGKVNDASLTGLDLTKSTLDGAHVVNGTLTGFDVEDGTIARRDLVPGAAGLTEIRTVNGPQDAGTQGQDMESRAQCPVGWDVVGGGYDAFVESGNAGDVNVSISRPFQRFSDRQAEWLAYGRNVGGIGVGTARLTAHAICVR